MANHQISTIDEIKEKMLESFGFSNFKSSWQEEAVVKIYEANKNVIVSLPTHGGKSLTFQIQSVLQPNKTILVFCPSLALMENQVIYLKSKGFYAEGFNSHTDNDLRDAIIHDLKKDLSPVQFLFITPEMFASHVQLSTVLRKMLQKKKILMVVVDEAHTIYDRMENRPSYAELKKFRAEFGVQWVALTTISQKMLPQVSFLLGMNENNLTFIKAPLARENIHYDVMITESVDDALTESILEFSTEAEERSGIIYVSSINDAMRFAEFLEHTLDGFNVEPYFADMPERFETQQRWMNGETHIIVATTESFGFGVMRNSVRFVIHLCRSINLRAFYQETGRAGVDGQMSYSRVIISSRKESDEINEYLFTKECRRRFICKSFDEPSTDCVAKCDNCLETYKKN